MWVQQYLVFQQAIPTHHGQDATKIPDGIARRMPHIIVHMSEGLNYSDTYLFYFVAAKYDFANIVL